MLELNPKGLTTSALAQQLDWQPEPDTLHALEALLIFHSEVDLEGRKWKIIKKSRKNNILSAIEAYANSSGKKIFRLSAALTEIPTNEHPTEDELKEILDGTNGNFQLLRNAMIKRNR
jgi:hypothetical protein